MLPLLASDRLDSAPSSTFWLLSGCLASLLSINGGTLAGGTFEQRLGERKSGSTAA